MATRKKTTYSEQGAKIKKTEVFSDGRKRKSKTVVKTKGGKRAKTKIKYNKDGTIKKVVSKIGGKRQVIKPKKRKVYKKVNRKPASKKQLQDYYNNLSPNRDTPLPKSDW
jgi:hypothetical protein